MPYLDSKIDKHYKNCDNPVGKRLYIRDYDDKGKQKFVSWGLTCTTCGVVVKEKYERNLTKVERRYHDKETLEWSRKRKIEHKLFRLKRRKGGPDSVTYREEKLRKRLTGMGIFCKDMFQKGHSGIPWDDELAEQFLNTYPAYWQLKQVLEPAGSIMAVLRADIYKGGPKLWEKYMPVEFKKLLTQEIHWRQNIMRDHIKSLEVKK